VRRHYETGFGPSTFKGHSHRAEAIGHAALPAGLALDFGADSEWSQAESSFDPKAKSRLSSAHALLGWYTPAVSLAAGLRADDHSRFGTHWTLGANGSVALTDGWRFRASYGEGFKAPTLYQLFGGFVGNTALKPERSRSYDAGIEKGDRNGPLHIAATWFRRDSRNLIDTDADFVYQNVARARAQGFEVELGAQVSERFHAQGAYTYLKARDRTLGRDLPRRPRHAVTANLDWQTPWDRLRLGGDLRFASKGVEYDFLGAPTRLDSYVVGTLRAELAVSDRIMLFGRVENVGDADYETAAGFNTPGRSAYVGARARF
jgi:vitamin B12 transporter